LILLKLGWEIGRIESEEANASLKASRVDEFISEEQIFDYLFNKGKEAVFLQFYTPGHSLDQKFMRTFEESSKDERYDKI